MTLKFEASEYLRNEVRTLPFAGELHLNNLGSKPYGAIIIWEFEGDNGMTEIVDGRNQTIRLRQGRLSYTGL